MERPIPAAVRAYGADPGDLVTDPDPRWEAFAAREPYFAVLTAPRFLRANLTPDHEREFFASGEALVAWMFRLLDHVSPNFSPMSMLEYGCGPGRLAIPLARRPGSVTAVDRSPAMLSIARAEAAKRGAGDIEFRSPAELFAGARRFDFICCVHVLQRMPPDAGLRLVRGLMRRLARGGIAVFHAPFRTSASAPLRASRWCRDHLPLVNGVVNTLRGLPFADPLIPGHVYDLDRLLGVLDEESAESAHVVYEHSGELSSVTVFAYLPLPSIETATSSTPITVGPEPVEERNHEREPVAASLDDANRAAEQYFASLTDWNDHLAKPFGPVGDTPRLLADAAALLHGARLVPGAIVLEFGAGTGWLSRWMTQLGCEVILLDVSETALRMARELYDRHPPIGDRPAPRFLRFDGRRIDLPDASVDRIVTFDAFHHAPNPDAVLREFGRILKPGGIAAFAEPGARHSDSPMSQFEMRTHHVVENDVDVHAIWRTARACGFSTLKLALFHGPPFYVTLREYEDFLAGGETIDRWRTSARVFLRNARHFFLGREGEEPLDSRTTEGLACAIDATLRPPPTATRWIVDATVTNVGTARWLPGDARVGGVRIGAHLFDAEGRLLVFDFGTAPLTSPPREVLPGESIACALPLPAQPAGRYRLEIDCVASRVAWFAQLGSRVVSMDVDAQSG